MDNSTSQAPVGPYKADATFSSSVAIFLAAVACLGVAGNLLIILAVCVDKKLRVCGNALVVNLAVADLIITAYLMPIGLATSQSRLEPLTHALCSAHAVLLTTACGVSTLSLTLIAVERYTRICRLSSYDRLFHARTVTFYVAFLWLLSVALALQGFSGWTSYQYSKDVYMCSFSAPYSLSYDASVSLIGIVLPLLVIIFCYVSIFRTVAKSKTAVASHAAQTHSDVSTSRHRQRDYQFRVLLVIIVVTYGACWLPCACVVVLSGVLPGGAIPDVVYTIVVWIALCNSTMNSIIYGVMNMNFRRGYAVIAQKLFCCCCAQSCACVKQSLDGSSIDEETRMPAGGKTNTYRSNVSSARSDITDFSTLPAADNRSSVHKRETSTKNGDAGKPQKLSKHDRTVVTLNMKSQMRHQRDVNDNGHINSAYSEDITFKAQY